MPDKCPACAEGRVHTPEEWKNHPLAGHGLVAGRGWTHPDALAAHNAEVEALALKPPPLPKRASGGC
jgi:hypothetical protein